MRLPLGRLLPAANHDDRHHPGPQQDERGRLGNHGVRRGAFAKVRPVGLRYAGRLTHGRRRSGSDDDPDEEKDA
jgi:hypothetical protein